LKPHHIYKQFTVANGEKVTLRRLESTDLDKLLSFINNLVAEKEDDRNSTLYTGFDSKVTRVEEARYLRETLAAIKQGSVISVVAEVNNGIIANGEVTMDTWDSQWSENIEDEELDER